MPFVGPVRGCPIERALNLVCLRATIHFVFSPHPQPHSTLSLHYRASLRAFRTSASRGRRGDGPGPAHGSGRRERRPSPCPRTMHVRTEIPSAGAEAPRPEFRRGRWGGGRTQHGTGHDGPVNTMERMVGTRYPRWWGGARAMHAGAYSSRAVESRTSTRMEWVGVRGITRRVAAQLGSGRGGPRAPSGRSWR